jgi:putative CocE/NonD family hydrolase
VVQLAWFDHWLKGVDTGITSTRAPLHLYELGAGQWVDTTTWPVPGTVVHTYWLGPGTPGTDAPSTNNGTLTSTRPASSAGSDTVAWTGASSPCSRATNQWSFGAVSLVTTSSPCDTDDRTTQAGPGSLTYTTPAFTSPSVVAGPIDATLYATSTAPDTEFVLRLDDIAPDGSSTSLTTGALLGSFRALDRSQSWYLHGSLIEPYHDYTRASVRAVPTGKVVRYDVELFPTLAELATGHRLRLTIQTSDTPHLIPTPLQASGLAGGVYAIQRSAAAASYVNVPVAPQTAFAPSHCPVCQ